MRVHWEALEWNWSQRNAAVMLTFVRLLWEVLTLATTFCQTSPMRKLFGSNSKIRIRLIVSRCIQRWVLVSFKPVHCTEDIFITDSWLCPWNQRHWKPAVFEESVVTFVKQLRSSRINSANYLWLSVYTRTYEYTLNVTLELDWTNSGSSGLVTHWCLITE
jgi:hypothetical protein